MEQPSVVLRRGLGDGTYLEDLLVQQSRGGPLRSVNKGACRNTRSTARTEDIWLLVEGQRAQSRGGMPGGALVR